MACDWIYAQLKQMGHNAVRLDQISDENDIEQGEMNNAKLSLVGAMGAYSDKTSLSFPVSGQPRSCLTDIFSQN